jgi:hypothetical protein
LSISSILKKGEKKETAVFHGLEATLPKWMEAQRLTRVIPVEKNTPELIRKKQNPSESLTFMGLTARPPQIADATERQLDSLSIDLSKRSIHATSLELERNYSSYLKGILYSGPFRDKGKTLVHFFQVIGFKPSRIIFVDDKQTNVESLEEAFKPLGTKYYGFRYGAADAVVKNYDRKTADIQQRNMPILSDSAALFLSNNGF